MNRRGKGNLYINGSAFISLETRIRYPAIKPYLICIEPFIAPHVLTRLLGARVLLIVLPQMDFNFNFKLHWPALDQSLTRTKAWKVFEIPVKCQYCSISKSHLHRAGRTSIMCHI